MTSTIVWLLSTATMLPEDTLEVKEDDRVLNRLHAPNSLPTRSACPVAPIGASFRAAHTDAHSSRGRSDGSRGRRRKRVGVGA